MPRCSLPMPLLLAAGLILLGSAAHATPMITVTADGVESTVFLEAELDGSGNPSGKWVLPGGNDWTWNDSEFSITLGAEIWFDPDPVITYFQAVQDSGAPSSFSFVFTQAIVATAAPGTAFHNNSGSTTDTDGGGVPVTAGPVPAIVDPFNDDDPDQDGNAEIFVFSLSTDGGTSFFNAGLDLRQDFSGPANTSGNPVPALDETGAGPAGSGNYDFMRIDANFGMQGGGDIYTWNGRAEIVPEPATAGMLGLGLAGLALLGRRRR